MKTKRRKPSQLAREFRLRKCFNCGERGHLSLEYARPCYKCNIAGHHSARCPYPVNRAPSQEASSSSPSSVQSTPERPVWPTSEGFLQQQWRSHPPRVCSLPPLLRRIHPWGEAYSLWVPFCPCHQQQEGLSCWLPWTGTGMQLRPELDSPRHPFPPDNRAPGLQQQLGLPLSPLLRLQHSRDWVRPRLGNSSSAPPVPPRSPPQRLQLFQAQIQPQPRNSHGHPPALRPRSSLTLHLHKVNRWEGMPRDRVRPRPVAPRERVLPPPWPGQLPQSLRLLPLPSNSLQLPGMVRGHKGVSAPRVARCRHHLRRIACPLSLWWRRPWDVADPALAKGPHDRKGNLL